MSLAFRCTEHSLPRSGQKNNLLPTFRGLVFGSPAHSHKLFFFFSCRSWWLKQHRRRGHPDTHVHRENPDSDHFRCHDSQWRQQGCRRRRVRGNRSWHCRSRCSGRRLDRRLCSTSKEGDWFYHDTTKTVVSLTLYLAAVWHVPIFSVSHEVFRYDGRQLDGTNLR